jgi:lactoylglutathione lyase
MVRDFLHVGVGVEDLEKSIVFYRDVMQMEEEFRAYHEGERISRVVGVDKATLNVCVLKKGNVRIELIEYGNRLNGGDGHKKQNETGLIHIAFRVDDVDEEYERIRKHGYDFFAPPMVTRENGPKITYFKGPDNVIVEIYQKV